MSEKLDNNKCIFSEEFNNKDNLTVKKEDIINQLKEVFDPEIPVNIYDLGLIYEIRIDDEKKVKIEKPDFLIRGVAYPSDIASEVP